MITGSPVNLTSYIGSTIARANGGADMFDAFSAAGIVDGQVTVYNADATGILAIKSETTLDGLSTSFVMLGPKQGATFWIDGGAVRTISPRQLCMPRSARRWYVRNYGSGQSDLNTGLRREDAFASIEAAYNAIRTLVNANLQPQEIFCCWDGTSAPADYFGAIIVYQVLGLPRDFGITLRGETDSGGNVRVRVADGGDGGIHVAGGAQVYIRNIAVRTLLGRPSIIVPFEGKAWLDNVVLYGAAGSIGTVGASLIEAGGVNGYVSQIGPISVIDDGSSTIFANSLFRSYDGGKLYSETGTVVTLSGNPRFARGTFVCERQADMYLQNSWVGGAVGPRWRGTGLSTITTPAGQSINSWAPGTSNGFNDGSCWVF